MPFSGGKCNKHQQILKHASDTLSHVICELFNKSIGLGKYPSKLKMSKIIPIYKANDTKDTYILPLFKVNDGANKNVFHVLYRNQKPCVSVFSSYQSKSIDNPAFLPRHSFSMLEFSFNILAAFF